MAQDVLVVGSWNSVADGCSGGVFEGGIASVFVGFDNDPVEYCFGSMFGTSCPCSNNGAPGMGCANSAFSTGAGLRAIGASEATTTGDSLVLNALNLSGPSLFFQGTAAIAGGRGSSFGDGLRCAGGNVVRLGVVFPAASTATIPNTTSPAQLHVAGACSPGDTRFYQTWYRDAATFCTTQTSNLTNGVLVYWR